MQQNSKCVLCLRDVCSRTKRMQKKGKDAKFHLYCPKNLLGPKKKIPHTNIHKYTKTNKDKDKISPILPERDLPRPLSNAGSCSSNYSTAPTSPLKKRSCNLSFGDIHTSLQNSICFLFLAGHWITKNVCTWRKIYPNIHYWFCYLFITIFFYQILLK